MAIITISQRSHSGGVLLAEMLHSKLGWRMIGQDDVSAAAAEAYRITEKELFDGLHHPANFFERFTHRKERYLLATQATVAKLVPDGNAIYYGIAGQFLFQELCNAFKVRIVAPLEFRVETAMQRLGVSRAEAVRILGHDDEHRTRWSRQIFGVDITDPDLYDLVVNLENLSIEAAAEMITDAVGRDEPESDCLAEYQDFALERRVRAELFFNSPFSRGSTEVRVKDSEVRLSGGKVFQTNRDSIARFVSQIPGVETVATGGQVYEASLDDSLALTSEDARAADVMLPPEHYPHCRLGCTIREATVALSASAIRLEDGHIMIPRYVLVLDDDDRLVGVVSRRELLKGLIPHLLEDRETEAHIKEFIPFGGTTPPELMIRWTSLFTESAVEAAKHPIKTVMVPIRGAVQVDDTLSTIITTMLHHGIDLVPVLDGKKVAGVVLMTNIFDIVANFVMEHGEGRSHDG
jgi:cytidylate kinase/CBS domain-containing protein